MDFRRENVKLAAEVARIIMKYIRTDDISQELSAKEKALLRSAQSVIRVEGYEVQKFHKSAEY